LVVLLKQIDLGHAPSPIVDPRAASERNHLLAVLAEYQFRMGVVRLALLVLI
jgi:hypothetical protein